MAVRTLAATSPATMITTIGTVTPATTGVLSAGADTTLACGVNLELVTGLLVLAPGLVTSLASGLETTSQLLTGLLSEECFEATMAVFVVVNVETKVTVLQEFTTTAEEVRPFANKEDCVFSVKLVVTRGIVELEKARELGLGEGITVTTELGKLSLVDRDANELAAAATASLELAKMGPIELAKEWIPVVIRVCPEVETIAAAVEELNGCETMDV